MNQFVHSRIAPGLLVLMLGLFLAACATSAGDAEQSTERTITLEACQLSAPGLTARIDAECGALTVFEDRAAQSGRTIDLNIAVVPAVSRDASADPLFFLTGGPGQAATESFVGLAPAFEQINQERDIVLVDQRGTGGSNALRCPIDEQSDMLEGAALEAYVRDCLGSLDANPALYTTSIAIDDLEQVRAALGYEQINLYGVSYGSRAALTYVRQYPERVRAVILDGVLPQDSVLGLYVARDAQRALDLIFDRCAADLACNEAFPDLRATFDRLLATFEQPVDVSLIHPITGAPTELSLTRDTVATTVRFMSYAPETAALLPLLIHSAQTTGDYSRLAAQSLMVGEDLTRTISNGMAFSVLCSEDAPLLSAAAAAQANANTYLGDLQTEQLAQTCAIWPRGEVTDDFTQPVSSDAPTLLLSGEADPVTPPSNGEQTARTLPNSLHLVAPGQGHVVVGRGCIPRIATEFIERGATDGIDTACVQELRPAPFFTSLAGPQP